PGLVSPRPPPCSPTRRSSDLFRQIFHGRLRHTAACDHLERLVQQLTTLLQVGFASHAVIASMQRFLSSSTRCREIEIPRHGVKEKSERLSRDTETDARKTRARPGSSTEGDCHPIVHFAPPLERPRCHLPRPH